MKEFAYVITDELGIHARPGSELVKLARTFTSEIQLSCNGRSADAKRLIAVMSLGAKQGHTLTVMAEGPDKDAAIAAIKKFLETSL